MESKLALHAVPDDVLLRRLDELVSQSRRVEADLVAHIGEVDERRLYASQAFPSMFAYCTQGLHLSEAEAYRRITVARAARRHPVLLTMLREGRLHLSGVAKLVPLLTPHNCAALLERATHLTKRQIEELVAELSPQPDAPSGMRKLAPERVAPSKAASGEKQGSPSTELVPGTVGTNAKAPASGLGSLATPAAPLAAPAAAHALTPSRPAVVEPLSPGRYKVQFTASAELRNKIERLSALMRSEVPDGDLATIIERAVTEQLERLETRRFAKTDAPRKSLADTHTVPASRHIPAAVRRAVSQRDGIRCRFVDEQGRRCSERHRLEFHHRYPFGMGGDHSPGNISLLCAQHNRYIAEQDYGQAATRWQRPDGIRSSGQSSKLAPERVQPSAQPRGPGGWP